MYKGNVTGIRAICAGLVLLGTAWLMPVNAMASAEQDFYAGIEKAFPSLYERMFPDLLTTVQVALLEAMLKQSLHAAEEFNKENGRYPADEKELASHMQGAELFHMSVYGGGGKVFPTFRIEHRDNSRIVGSATEGMIYVSDKARILEKEAACHGITYMRDFLRDADAKTGEHFMQVIGVPDGTSREDVVADMSAEIKDNCSE